MSPRNLDDTNCKDKLYTGEPHDSQLIRFAPNILHKKHKVIKLVKNQLLNLQEQGLLSAFDSLGNDNGGYHERGSNTETFDGVEKYQLEMLTRDAASIEFPESEVNSKCSFVWVIVFLLSMFSLLFAAAWLSAGPFSNRTPHTPIPWGSLISIDNVCELEKRCSLRWSTSNHLE